MGYGGRKNGVRQTPEDRRMKVYTTPLPPCTCRGEELSRSFPTEGECPDGIPTGFEVLSTTFIRSYHDGVCDIVTQCDASANYILVKDLLRNGTCRLDNTLINVIYFCNPLKGWTAYANYHYAPERVNSIHICVSTIPVTTPREF